MCDNEVAGNKNTAASKLNYCCGSYVLTDNFFLRKAIIECLMVIPDRPTMLYIIDWEMFGCVFALRDYLLDIHKTPGRKIIIILNDPFVSFRKYSYCKWVLPGNTRSHELSLLVLKASVSVSNIDGVVFFYNRIISRVLLNPSTMRIVKCLSLGVTMSDISKRMGVPLKTIYGRLQKLRHTYNIKSTPQLIFLFKNIKVYKSSVSDLITHF